MIKGEYPALLNEKTGEWTLCSSKDEMAAILGVNVRTIYRYINEQKSPEGYTIVEEKLRVFLVRTKDGRFRICKRATKEGMWVVMSSSESDREVIMDDQMEKWMDISETFYNGKRHGTV